MRLNLKSQFSSVDQHINFPNSTWAYNMKNINFPKNAKNLVLGQFLLLNSVWRSKFGYEHVLVDLVEIFRFGNFFINWEKVKNACFARAGSRTLRDLREISSTFLKEQRKSFHMVKESSRLDNSGSRTDLRKISILPFPDYHSVKMTPNWNFWKLPNNVSLELKLMLNLNFSLKITLGPSLWH